MNGSERPAPVGSTPSFDVAVIGGGIVGVATAMSLLRARLLAAEGTGRDDETVRWALHDLTLPQVWAANPTGERGASMAPSGRKPGATVITAKRDAVKALETVLWAYATISSSVICSWKL